MLDRVALVVTPRRRFIEWVNTALPSDGHTVTMDEAKSLRTIFLVAGGDGEADFEDLVDTYADELFAAYLSGWTDDESLWPINRTPHVFRDWFQVEGVDDVTDADPTEPLTVSERMLTRCASCGVELEDVTFVGLIRDGTRRLSADEAAECDMRLAEAAGPEDAEGLTIVIRCCGEQCASAIEVSYARALQENEASDD